VALALEDYALIGDTQTAGLVGRDGSIDWLCLPRFDSGACFAALLGDPDHGRWFLAPAADGAAVRRRYRPGTLVLESEYDTPDGTVRVVDCMPPRAVAPDVLRIVEGVSGRVPMHLELAIRFDYGSIVPWVTRDDGVLRAIGGPDSVILRSPGDLHADGRVHTADFSVAAGERVAFHLAWHPSNRTPNDAFDVSHAVGETERWWSKWSSRFRYDGHYPDAVQESLVILKALTYAPTGGIVAAPTTSLPEQLGGVRNWDYRYCWLRDATVTLYSLMNAGYEQEAHAWRDWLLRAVAGDPAQLQIMYGVAGERRLPELELDWLPGYQGAAPVRTGNAAALQFQLDVYGEVLDCLHQARSIGLTDNPQAWNLTLQLMDFLEGAWSQPDEGLWEVRGPRRHFTHSKVMAWVAADRAVKAVERFSMDGPADRWRALRDDIHRDVCEKAWDDDRQSFVQYYGADQVDAALLMLAQVRFLPPNDPRIVGTVAAIERDLVVDGFVHRYPTDDAGSVDGLPAGEGAFLPCTFWLADNWAMQGRLDEARALFERLLSLRTDCGLLAEEYDVGAGRLVGNIPQAWSHVSLVNTAQALSRASTSPEKGPQRGE
jgi:GH15 family glucan-1,4-alpha-glucosidase